MAQHFSVHPVNPQIRLLKQAVALLALHGGPLLATTLIPPGETEPLNDAEMILEHFAHGIAAVIDAGACPSRPTTVVDMTGGDIVVLRQGRGDIALVGL